VVRLNKLQKAGQIEEPFELKLAVQAQYSETEFLRQDVKHKLHVQT